MLKKILLSIFILVILVLALLVFQNYPRLEVVSSYAAKKMCSCTFISQRSQEKIQEEDLARSPLGISSTEIDLNAKSVSTSVYGLHKKTAQYRDKLGCVLIHGKDDYKIKSPIKEPKTANLDTLAYPYGNKMFSAQMKTVDYDKLKEVISNTFDENDAMTKRRTRALLVLHKDTIIAEHYAEGYTENTEMLGWSMTKSIMNAFTGMLVKDNKIALDDQNLFEEWKDDGRSEISLRNLLNMNSGLEWEEVYSEISSATKMLFMAEDIVKVARSPKLEFPVGEVWEYSSGTSNLVSGYLRNQFDNHDDYLRFPHERIFEPLGMNNTYMEIDEAGNYIGSSYCYATARDWAKFGTLYLREGEWNGERLLPEGWVNFTKTTVPASGGKYGAHFWTNVDGAMYEDAPSDLFSMNGFEGQFVYIIPSKDLIIVRLGLNENFNFNQMISKICEAVDYE